MASGWWANLPQRSVVSVRGTDARHFLQNLVTTDLDPLGSGDAGFGALLSPQGKVLFDFLVFVTEDGFLLDTPSGIADDLVARLSLYRLRAPVDVAKVTDREVQVAWGTESAPSGFVADPRVNALGFRRIVEVGSEPLDAGIELDAGAFDDHRIKVGVPDGGADFAYGDVFPHDVNLDQLNGVAFTKGCFVGQEVVSRMQHRGTARRRIVRAEGNGLEAGAEITAGSQSVGEVASTVGRSGLASVRLDRAARAKAQGLQLMAGGQSVEIAVPEWATFGLEPAEIS